MACGFVSATDKSCPRLWRTLVNGPFILPAPGVRSKGAEVGMSPERTRVPALLEWRVLVWEMWRSVKRGKPWRAKSSWKDGLPFLSSWCTSFSQPLLQGPRAWAPRYSPQEGERQRVTHLPLEETLHPSQHLPDWPEVSCVATSTPKIPWEM